jgi:arginase
MRLVDGALAIQGDLPASATTLVDVPLEAGDFRGTAIARFGSLQLVRDRQLAVLRELTSPAITIGGDCGVELAAVEHALEQHPDTAVLWFDAHPDLHTAQSSASGAFTGMVLRALLGDGELAPAVPLDPSRVVLVGARSVDDAEAEFLANSGIASIGLADPEQLLAAVAATGATSIYIHIDVDALDPAEFASKGDPVPFGFSVVELVALITAARGSYNLVGAGITEFAPSSPEAANDDLPTLLRIIGALTR